MRAIVCDVCRKPTKRIVAKMYLSPKNGHKNDHSNYTAHADVGECCGAKVLADVRWVKRVRQAPKPKTAKKRQQRKSRAGT